MYNCLGYSAHKVCEPYLDDILCYGQSFEEHLQNLEMVLRRLKTRGVKLRADKCHFFKPETRYLGRLISKDGYRPDPRDTLVLEKYRSPPKNNGELRSLLGFLGYYRPFVQDFAKKMKPLYNLLRQDASSKETTNLRKSRKDKKKKKGQQYNAKCLVNWNNKLQSILDTMIDYLRSPEVISYPDFNLPFFVTCDSCDQGLDAVLYQKQNGVSRVISFASRTLSDAERNYHLQVYRSSEIWTIVHSLYRQQSSYLCAHYSKTECSWVVELADYDFGIKYRPGKVNTDADFLSRNSMGIDEYIGKCTEVCAQKSIDSVISSVSVCPVMVCGVDVKMLCLEPEKQKVEVVNLADDQNNDKLIGPVYRSVLRGCRPGKTEWKNLSRGSKLLMQNFGKLVLENGILLRKTSKSSQIILSKKFHQLICTELHEKMAHLGPEKVIDLAQQRFYWPFMAKEITHYIQKKC